MFGVNRYIIHVACADSIERWVLNDIGSILEYGSKRLETPIENFLVDPSGEVMVSLEDCFVILRNRDLDVFNMYRAGRDVPVDAVIVQDRKKYLIACYESCHVMVSGGRGGACESLIAVR